MTPSSQNELLSSGKSYGLSCRFTLATVDMALSGLLAHVGYRVLLRSYCTIPVACTRNEIVSVDWLMRL